MENTALLKRVMEMDTPPYAAHAAACCHNVGFVIRPLILARATRLAQLHAARSLLPARLPANRPDRSESDRQDPPRRCLVFLQKQQTNKKKVGPRGVSRPVLETGVHGGAIGHGRVETPVLCRTLLCRGPIYIRWETFVFHGLWCFSRERSPLFVRSVHSTKGFSTTQPDVPSSSPGGSFV